MLPSFNFLIFQKPNQTVGWCICASLEQKKYEMSHWVSVHLLVKRNLLHQVEIKSAAGRLSEACEKLPGESRLSPSRWLLVKCFVCLLIFLKFFFSSEPFLIAIKPRLSSLIWRRKRAIRSKRGKKKVKKLLTRVKCNFSEIIMLLMLYLNGYMSLPFSTPNTKEPTILAFGSPNREW